MTRHAKTSALLPVQLIGSMDALAIENGVETLWELKTAKRKWSADQLEFDLQSTVYRIAARSMGYDPELKLLVTTKANTPDVQVERLVRHRRDEVELVETIFSVHRAAEAVAVELDEHRLDRCVGFEIREQLDGVDGRPTFGRRVLHAELVIQEDLDKRLNGFGAQREDVFAELGRKILLDRAQLIEQGHGAVTTRGR